ncbi:SDR family oxidoreductase [Mucilaginibacter sp. E4BP6]|uniref:SDR family oxidoreductase n=1 Tax=Mucilaginibacter sp. E4BP6 TaxID=2723089 RepID=UPI0015CA2F04|nr:SDR family oxidoreductase [Mucilaginibacter sp. E4BP6]NYE67018.1 NAD(P)-dependent dehydrogenase (short-subunit alcohol dehydrogenase family) [Mucilaginibacter sp. E4BP6]
MNKTILITGASSGFGKSSAKLFAANGWNVIATMRSPEKEEELTTIANICVLKLDVQDEPTIRKAIADGLARFGSIDVLVNNAGYALRGVFESLTKEQIKRQYDVNVFGLMDVTQAIIPYFRERGSGLIINISSMGGRITIPLLSLYHSTKFAVEGFTEALSYELSAVNIRVKLIEPGGVRTNFGTTSIEEVPNGIQAYDEMIKYFQLNRPKVTQHMASPNATSEEVAEVIFQAATDDTNRLRYVIGKDAELYVNGRLNHNDQDYFELMNSYFLKS